MIVTVAGDNIRDHLPNGCGAFQTLAILSSIQDYEKTLDIAINMKRRARGAQGMLDSLSDKATPLTTSDALVTGLDIATTVTVYV